MGVFNEDESKDYDMICPECKINYGHMVEITNKRLLKQSLDVYCLCPSCNKNFLIANISENKSFIFAISEKFKIKNYTEDKFGLLEVKNDE